MSNQIIRKSYAPFILLTACVLVALGWWFSEWIRKVDYSTDGFQVITAENFHPEDVQGYTLYLDFWASWCIPCRQSFPWMQEMRQRFSENGLRIVAVNLDQDKDAMQEFLAGFNVDFAIVTDPGFQFFARHEIQGVPTSIVFDSNGKEVWRHPGFRPEHTEKYEKKLIEILETHTIN